MSTLMVTLDGVEYPIAPIEPEKLDRPGPMVLMAITPYVAKCWLRYNRINRAQRARGKRNYGTDMKEGNFLLNGSSITFTRPYLKGEDENVPEGEVTLLDGQHRLESCASSNETFVTYVGYGFAPEVRHTVDTGIKRTYGDVLRLQGQKDANVLASVVKKAVLWKTGDHHLTGKSKSLTHSMMDEFFKKNPKLRRSAEIARLTHTEFSRASGYSLRQAVVGLAHWLFVQADETLTPEFFARLGDGCEMHRDDPIMQLRRRLVSDLNVPRQERGQTRRELPNVPDWQQLCYYIRTWNARLIYAHLPLEEQIGYTFAMVGPKDKERMPEVRGTDWAYDELLKMEARKDRALKAV